MIKKILVYILLTIIFATTSYANFQVSYLEDTKNYKNINEVMNKNFTKIPKKITFGNKKYVWLKVNIENIKKEKERNYLSITNLQIMEDVHFYTVKNNKLIKENKNFNKYTNNNIPQRIGNTLVYENDIAKNESIDVYIYISAKSHIYFDINNGSFNEVMSKVSKTTTILIFLVGALAALGVYYIFLYIFTPNPAYLYYTLFVFSLLLWSFYIYGGYAYYFNIFRIGDFSNTFVILLPIFTILFFKSIYKNNKEFYKYNIALNILLTFLSIFLILYILSKFDLITYISIGKYGAIIYLISLVYIMSISIIIYMKKLPFSSLFLLGYSANFIGSLASIGFFLGKVPYNIFTLHGNIIGGVMEAILFSILLTYTMKKVYKEKDEAINATKIQNIKISIMNETIDFISHQWRQPLSQINSSVLVIDDIAYENKLQIKKLDDELLHIENITNYMSSTIDDFRNLFSKDKEDEIFSLNTIVSNTIQIIQKELTNKKIKLNIDTEEVYIEGNKGDIAQVLLVILNNAKDAILERKIANAEITISLFSKDNKANLNICDNAGGIQEKLMKKIFTAYYTTKNKSRGSGLGLYIAKMVIETKMRGLLYIKNNDKGACFCIELDKKDKQ